jgi:hypothetical protein
MNKVICLKINASLYIVSSVHVVRTTGMLFSDYDLRVSECDYVTTGNYEEKQNKTQHDICSPSLYKTNTNNVNKAY